MKARRIINRAEGQGSRVKGRGAKPKIHIKQKTNIFQKMLDLLGCLCYNGITSEGLFFAQKNDQMAILAYVVCASHCRLYMLVSADMRSC